MSKFDQFESPRNDGEVRGGNGDLPNRGTSSGMVGEGAPYGADIGPNATNRLGGFHGGSDSAFDNTPPGDTTRFTSSGHSSPSDGGSDVPADSHPAAKTSHDDQRQ